MFMCIQFELQIINIMRETQSDISDILKMFVSKCSQLHFQKQLFFDRVSLPNKHSQN